MQIFFFKIVISMNDAWQAVRKKRSKIIDHNVKNGISIMERKDRALRSCISDRRYLNAHFSTKLWVSAGPISVGFLMVLDGPD